jgi:uncharacterized RDD family membrane protein YckC
MMKIFLMFNNFRDKMQLPPELPTYNPYAAPVARLSDAPVQVVQLASRGSRLGAYLLDIFSVGLLGIVAAVVMPTFAQVNSGEMPYGVVAILGLGGLALLILNIVLLHKNGQTIGKRLVGIKVIQIDGNRCELWRFFFLRALPTGLINSVLSVIGMILDSVFIFGQEQRCLHDLIANTIVIQA